MLTPCIKVCVLDESGVCEGCSRTVDEIRNWTKMTDFERHIIYERIHNNTNIPVASNENKE